MKLSMPSVLVVDDDANVRSALERSLKRNGYRSILSESAEDAVDALTANPVDVILLDLRLPGMDGHSFLRLLHRDDATFPVVIMSGAGTMEDAIKAMQLNACDFLQKPFDDQELVRALDRALERRTRAAATLAATLAASTPARPASSSGVGAPVPRPESVSGPFGPGQPAPRSGLTDISSEVDALLRGFGAFPEQARPAEDLSSGGRSAPPLDIPTAMQEVERRLASGDLVLPVLDERIGRVQELMERPSCGVEEVLDVVGKDPTLASLCLRAANSSYFNPGTAIGNLRQACVQLGNRRVVAFAVEALVKGSFAVRREPFNGIMGRLWQNSLITARLADRFARICYRVHPCAASALPHVENLYVAALLHNLGELLLLQLISQVDGLRVSAESDLQAFADFVAARHEILGAKLSRKWQLPCLVTQLAGHHHRPTGPYESDSERFVRTLVLAAWAVAVDGGYGYLPLEEPPDTEELLREIGIDPLRIQPLYEQMSAWISASE